MRYLTRIEGKTYKEQKENLRNFAIEWQQDAAENNLSWTEMIYWQGWFERMGRRFGLLNEFRENGIC